MFRPSLFVSLLLSATPALAQRTTNNAVTSSEDAFGRAVGNERIGIYSPEDIRGFNPIEAGNARLEGLYFDQQGLVVNRLIDSSSVRVGYAAQPWPFPAPTGIVNLQLEKFEGENLLSLEGEVDADGNYGTTVQGKLRIAGDKLGLSIGNGTRHSRIPNGRFIDFFGHAANLTWRPTNAAEVNLFWSHFRADNTGGTPILFPGGAFVPPKIERKDYIGQDWAHGENHNHVLGLTAKAPLGGLRLELGLFRSIADQNRGFNDVALGVGRDGSVTREQILADANQYSSSNSGEVRVYRSFGSGALQHRVTAMIRGRQQRREFGGQVALALGATNLFQRVAVTRPNFTNGPTNTAQIKQFTPGLAYELLTTKGLRLGASLQHSRYRRTLDFANPLIRDSKTADNPWLLTANATVPLSPKLRVYGGYVQGFEESPVAPDVATNNNEAPPAARTKQIDFGLRYAINAHFSLIAGAFRIEKPYYNLDAARRYGILGDITNKGLEFSLAGLVAPGLNIVAGALLLDPRISGPEVTSRRIGARPTGASRKRAILNLDWRLHGGKSPWSFDLAVDANGRVAGNATNSFDAPAREQLAISTRYRFDLAGAKWLARGQITNVFNDYGWRVTSSGGYLFTQPRTFILTLSTDI
jgi:iron complex outermembrane recepter protein